jgi:hypothetical protein
METRNNFMENIAQNRQYSTTVPCREVSIRKHKNTQLPRKRNLEK